jgi:5S rRNA maturation endonuclease (ribonuclease M5)/Zn-finger protein
MNLSQIKSFISQNIETIFDKLEIGYETLGDNVYCKCPIHDLSDNPRAFSFSKDRGIWRCWTRECQKDHKNDAIGLLQALLSKKNNETFTFNKTVSWLNSNFKTNILLEYTENVPQEEEDGFEKTVSLLSNKIAFPSHKIIDQIKIKTPSRYFLDRGFDKKTLQYFGVGDCLDSDSPLYDRALIPIHSDCGNHLIGYIGRSVKEYRIPKFLIYPKKFDKKYYLYNMHRAYDSIKLANSVIIVEGQGDVWKLYESGVYNVVGIFGRSLSQEQQKKLQLLPITTVVVLTDNDQVGRESKLQLQRQLSRFYKLKFPKFTSKDVGDMKVSEVKKELLSQI